MIELDAALGWNIAIVVRDTRKGNTEGIAFILLKLLSFSHAFLVFHSSLSTSFNKTLI